MRDVALAASAADGYDHALNRIQLQKLLYLVDAISLLFEIAPPTEAHRTYKHGPFDPAIQNAVDCLTFRGLMSVKSVSRQDDGVTSAFYELTKSGRAWASQLRKDPGSRIRGEASQIVADRAAQGLGWPGLRDLVYAEPTYVAARPNGWGQFLDPSDSRTTSSALFLRTIESLLPVPKDHAIDRDLLLSLYFEFLESAAQNSRLSADAEAK
jgi:hypothetical protein